MYLFVVCTLKWSTCAIILKSFRYTILTVVFFIRHCFFYPDYARLFDIKTKNSTQYIINCYTSISSTIAIKFKCIQNKYGKYIKSIKSSKSLINVMMQFLWKYLNTFWIQFILGRKKHCTINAKISRVEEILLTNFH